MKKIILITMAMLFIKTSLAQAKVEVEKKVSSDLVPNKALQFIEQIEDKKQLKWIKEISEEGVHFEAKFKKKKRYSIEFDSIGVLLDVEVNDPKIEHRENFERVLQTELKTDRFIIMKVQHQWMSPNHSLLIESVNKEIRVDKVQLKYELEIKTKGEDGIHYFEILLDEDLKVVKKRPIEDSNTDNLMY